ncbi:hypothetical protein ACHAWX_003868 [Stephanocyclus meneghinianus]
MSSVKLALSLLLINFPSHDGFVPQPFSTSCPRSTLRLLPSSLVERCRNGHRTEPDSGCAPRLSFVCRLCASESNDGGDNSANNDHGKNKNLKSDDELFRDTMNDVLFMKHDILSMEGDEYEDEESDEDEEIDPYEQIAIAEFRDNLPDSPTNNTMMASSLETALARQLRTLDATSVDWGGALETLQGRVSDIESGRSENPSYAIFRTITRERPNEAIGRFVREANPEVVASMSGAVSALLGSLSNPAMGIEVLVQASSEKLGQLCFQLMMTGYMFRNAEYVLALKSLMDIEAEATLEEYKAVFKKLDKDSNGYLEVDEVEAMLKEVYEGKVPVFEVSTFMEFFDTNNDGRISWEEFEKGFGGMKKSAPSKVPAYDPDARWSNIGRSLPGSTDDEDDEEDISLGEATVSGKIEVELDDGRVIEVDAQEYIDDLKQQALELKRELAKEMGETQLSEKDSPMNPLIADQSKNSAGGIASYIASLQGDVQSLTKGISPDVIEAMQLLIEFVLEGPASDRSGPSKMRDRKKVEMELPGSALQQLALWQLVIGYRLRETEATGDWRRMME